MNRRALVLTLATTLTLAVTTARAASDGRSYVTGYFALDLDGVACGLIQKFEGGDVEGEVTVLPVAHDYYVKKHIGNVKYNDFTLQMGLAMSDEVGGWIESAFSNDARHRGGSVKSFDARGRMTAQIDFEDGLITEVGFPACDGSAKDPAYLSLKFSPWIVRNKKGDGSKVDNPTDMGQKRWLPANFRLTVGGLDARKVSKIDAFTIKQVTPTTTTTNGREPIRVPGKLEFPALRVHVPDRANASWLEWAERFFAQDDRTDLRSGRLEFLDGDTTTVLGAVELRDCGLARLSVGQPGADGPETVAELLCEELAYRHRPQRKGGPQDSGRR